MASTLTSAPARRTLADCTPEQIAKLCNADGWVPHPHDGDNLENRWNRLRARRYQEAIDGCRDAVIVN